MNQPIARFSVTRACQTVNHRRQTQPASSNGLFMANDGRTFFYTNDALVPQDTNELHDVYEFVEGRPQLITTGTGASDTRTTPNQERLAGLVGVSANGVNVYFSTYETLVKQDRNRQLYEVL